MLLNRQGTGGSLGQAGRVCGSCGACVYALHDKPQGARRVTPCPQDSQAMEGESESQIGESDIQGVCVCCRPFCRATDEDHASPGQSTLVLPSTPALLMQCPTSWDRCVMSACAYPHRCESQKQGSPCTWRYSSAQCVGSMALSLPDRSPMTH